MLLALDVNSKSFEEHEIANVFDADNVTRGDPNFISKKKLKSNKKRFLPGGTLTIRYSNYLNTDHLNTGYLNTGPFDNQTSPEFRWFMYTPKSKNMGPST